MALGAIVSLICKEFGYSANQSAFFGLFFIIFGVIGSMIQASICDKWKTFKQQLIIICFLAVITSTALPFLFYLNIYLAIMGTALLGFSLIPILSHGYSCGS